MAWCEGIRFEPTSTAPRFTTHATIRGQQRGIDGRDLDLLLAYGRREHDHTGCELVYFDEDSLQALARSEDHRALVAARSHRNIYAVLDSDGVVVTVGHRFRRVIRDRSLSNARPHRGRRSPAIGRSGHLM